MLSTSTKKRLAVAVAATATLGSALAGGGSAVHADPKQYKAFVGVGSDTTQDIMNAMAGYSNGIYYTPIHSSAATGNVQIASWDATDNGSTTSCIATKTGGPSFNRPFGSGAGRSALLAAITAGGTVANTNCGSGTTAVSGQISFARSSSLSSTTGTSLAYVPFARDALSYGAYRKAGSPILDLSTTELNQIFTSATPVTITRTGGVSVQVIGCDIQTSSGTGTTWKTKVGGTFNTSICDGLIDPATSAAVGKAEENNGDQLVLRGDLADAVYPGVQVIIGFSVGNYIGKANGVAPGGEPTTVVIGAISDVAGGVNPVNGTRPNLTGNTTFYASSYGRDLYNVFPNSVINSAFGNDAIKELFKGSTSQLCLQTATIQAFGFQTLANCGDATTLRGG